MGKIKNSIKTFFKVIWTTFKIIYFILVLVMLGVIGFIAYCLHPLYMELEPTIPSEFYSSDKITWTFYRYAKNPRVFQRLTVFQDGRNIIEISRETGDFDIDMLGPVLPWNPQMNKSTGIITFKRKGILSKEKASRIFRDAIRAGALDIVDLPSVDGARCRIDVEVGLDAKIAEGPDFLGGTPAYPPEHWIKKIYWQKMTQLINADPQLKKYMTKLKYLKNKQKEIDDAIQHNQQ